jgi:UPF0716 protein FxsA
LIAIFVVIPLAELYVILAVGDAIGWLPTIAILAADSILGSVLLKTQGRAVWVRFNEQMQAGRVPTREILDGVLVIFGGAFLITPGFLTDIIGLLLLLPPTRSVFRGLVSRQLGRRAAASVGRRRRSQPPDAWDVDGTATERDQSDFELPPPDGRRVGRRP